LDENYSIYLLLSAPKPKDCNKCNHQLASKSIKSINCARFSTAHSPPRLALLTSCKLFQMLFPRLHRPLVRASPLWQSSRSRYTSQNCPDINIRLTIPGFFGILVFSGAFSGTIVWGVFYLVRHYPPVIKRTHHVLGPYCTESCKQGRVGFRPSNGGFCWECTTEYEEIVERCESSSS
jgi:hypothetical protein